MTKQKKCKIHGHYENSTERDKCPACEYNKQKPWEELREQLADIEHQRWASWQKYVHSNCVEHHNGEGKWVCFPTRLFKWWERQINTDYKDLPEREKNSDREQVDRYLPIIQEQKSQSFREGYNQAIKDFKIPNKFGEKSL